MASCEQTPGLSILEHGLSVRNYLFDLLNHLRYGKKLEYKWILPNWIYEYKDFILSKLPDDITLELYTKFHDCGKPFVKTIDTDGKIHFKNHSKESHKMFKKVFDNDIAARLILKDMDIHLLKSDGVREFCKSDLAITLLLSGLSEIHSNSEMFGGLDSTSFKIKYKSIKSRGRKILEILSNI
jgi:hypothetical protein